MLKKSPLERLRHRRVEVTCQGILYRGVFHGADEEMVYLKGETGYRMLRMDAISTVRIEGFEAGVRLRVRESGLSAEFYEIVEGALAAWETSLEEPEEPGLPPED